MKVFVVDDDAAVRESLGRALRLEGYEVELAADGAEALERLESDGVGGDLVVLDVLMPNVDGLEVCRRIRRSGSRLPVLMLTARDEVADRVAGLDAGADDYVVKPFSLDELAARLHALLRRARPSNTATSVVAAGPLWIDRDRRIAKVGDDRLDLSRREFDLLTTFAQNAGIVLSRIRLLELVWGYDFDVDTNVVDVFVGYLRRKLDATGVERLIETVRGVGFVLRVA